MYNSIDIKEIDRINITNTMNTSYKNILLDIRDKYEYILGHIPRSINIPYTYIITMPQNYLNLDATYYIYCDSGSKSRKVCLFLNELGYKAIDLIGGYKEYLDGR